MKVQIIGASTNSKWYKKLLGEVVDANRRPNGGYRLYYTEDNERIVQKETDDFLFSGLLTRLKADDGEIGLGISAGDGKEIAVETNKEASSLLSKEW